MRRSLLSILATPLWVSLLIGSPRQSGDDVVTLHLKKEVEQVVYLPKSAWEAGVLPPSAEGSRFRYFDAEGKRLLEGIVEFHDGRFLPPPSVLEEGFPLWLTPKVELYLRYDAARAG